MGIEKRQTKIEGHEYELTLFGAKQGELVLLRLAKVLAPAMRLIAEAIKAEDDAGIVAGMTTLVQGLSAEDWTFIRDSFVGSAVLIMTADTKAGPKPVRMPLAEQYDQHFARRTSKALRFVAWAMGENYGDFFAEMGFDVSGFLAQVPSKSESPPEQAGSSGAS